MPYFWTRCGFHFGDRDAEGKLIASDELLRARWQAGVDPLRSLDANR